MAHTIKHSARQEPSKVNISVAPVPATYFFEWTVKCADTGVVIRTGHHFTAEKAHAAAVEFSKRILPRSNNIATVNTNKRPELTAARLQGVSDALARKPYCAAYETATGEWQLNYERGRLGVANVRLARLPRASIGEALISIERAKSRVGSVTPSRFVPAPVAAPASVTLY